MDLDIVNYESMLAAKDSANYALWATCASVLSVFVSLATLGIAYGALGSWMEQERVKVKMEFKRAMLELKYSLEAMPENWRYLNINIAKARLRREPDIANHPEDEAQIYFRKNELSDAYNKATKEWLICGHLFPDDRMEKHWRSLSDAFRPYLLQGGRKSDISLIIDNICYELKIL